MKKVQKKADHEPIGLSVAKWLGYICSLAGVIVSSVSFAFMNFELKTDANSKLNSSKRERDLIIKPIASRLERLEKLQLQINTRLLEIEKDHHFFENSSYFKKKYND